MRLKMWRKSGQILSVKGKKGYFDVSYGVDSQSQKLDVWLPEGNGPFPAIISIHGGGYIACDKRQDEMITPMLNGLNKGYAVIGINYRLSTETPFPYPVRDIKQAIRYIRANAKSLNIDPEKIVLWGGSAGGYMTLMGCLCTDEEFFDNEYDPNKNISAKVCGGVTWYAHTDFTKCDEQLQVNHIINVSLGIETTDINEEYEPVIGCLESSEFPFHDLDDSMSSLFANTSLANPDESIEKVSPINYIHKNMPKIFMQHGSADEIIPMQQSINFALKANKICGEERVKLEIIPNAIHSSILFETDENVEKVFSFINELLS